MIFRNNRASQNARTRRERVFSLTFNLLIVGIFALGFVLRFSIPNIPFSGPDTIGYLGIVFQFQDKGFFKSIADRSFPYPLFLTLLISLGKNVSIISTTQHIIGLLAGFVFLKTMARVDSTMLRLTGVQLWIYWLLGCIGIYALLCSNWSVYIEHHTHPESLTIFLFCLMAYIFVRAYEELRGDRNKTILGFYASSLLFFGFFFFEYQPRFGLNFIFVSLTALTLLFWGLPFRRALMLSLRTFGLILLFLILPSLNYEDEEAIAHNRAASMFFHNMFTMGKLLSDDLNDPGLPAERRTLFNQMLEDLSVAADPANNFATGFNPSLGLNTDYLGRTRNQLKDTLGSFSASTDFMTSYYQRGWREHPLQMSQKIVWDFIYFYTPQRQLGSWEKDINFIWKYSYGNILLFDEHFPENKILDDYIVSLDYIRNPENFTPKHNGIFAVTSSLIHAGKLIYPAVIILFFALFVREIVRRGPYIDLGFVTSFFVFVQLGITLTIAISNTNSVTRYAFDQLGILILSLVFAMCFIFLCVTGMQVRKGRVEPMGPNPSATE